MQTNSHTPVKELKPQRVQHVTNPPPTKRPRQQPPAETSENLIAHAVDLLMEDDSLLCELMLLLCARHPCMACPAFAHFAREISFDEGVLLDFLLSSETADVCLRFLLKFLKQNVCVVKKTNSHSNDLSMHHVEALPPRVLSMLGRLRASLTRYWSAGLFPYNPAALLRRLPQTKTDVMVSGRASKT